MNKTPKNIRQHTESGVKGLLVTALEKAKNLCPAIFTRHGVEENAQKEHASLKNRAGDGTGIKPANEWQELVINAPILLLEEGVDKKRAFEVLLHECCTANSGIDEKSAFRSLLEREAQGATFVGSDIAIPHARLESIKRALVVIGVSKKGVVDRHSGNSARIIFLLLTPSSDPNSHIRMLGVITRLASDKEWRTKTIRDAER